MNSNLKGKSTKGSNNFGLKLDSKQINPPKLSKTTLHWIDDNLGETWLDKTQLDSKIKMTQSNTI